MRRTLVWLTVAQTKALTRMSKKSLAPVSALVREAVNESLRRGELDAAGKIAAAYTLLLVPPSSLGFGRPQTSPAYLPKRQKLISMSLLRPR